MRRWRNRESDYMVSWKDYVDTRFDEKEKALNAALAAAEKAVVSALDAAEKAVDKAEDQAKLWRQASNEWRAAMDDRDRKLPSRAEVDGQVNALDARLAILERKDAAVTAVAKTVDAAEARGTQWNLVWLALGGGLIATAAGVIGAHL